MTYLYLSAQVKLISKKSKAQLTLVKKSQVTNNYNVYLKIKHVKFKFHLCISIRKLIKLSVLDELTWKIQDMALYLSVNHCFRATINL